MKTYVITFLICMSFLFSANAQISMTVTGGISPGRHPQAHHIFVSTNNPTDEFMFDLKQIKPSFLIGVGAKYDVKPFFFAAEAQYNQRQYVYSITPTENSFFRSVQEQDLTETMDVVYLPVTLGVDLGVMDITSGFLPQVIVSQQSELESLEGYSQKLNRLRLGWHSGVGVNINAVRVGVSWQMDFNNYADHAYFNDQSIALQGHPSRWLGTVSYQF